MTQGNKEKQRVEEEAVYEKLRQRLSKTLGELNDKINRDTVSQAMEKAVADLKAMGDHSKEVVSRAAETMKKDISSSLEQLKPKLEEDLEKTRDDFNRLHNKGGALWRDIANQAEYIKELSVDKGAAFFLNVIRGLNDWTNSLTDKLDTSLSYKTGELTHGGQFTCTACGAEINLKKPGRLPPCPKCAKTEFRRS